MLAQCGYVMAEDEEGADVIVLNTCAIREHAEQRVYGNVGALVHTKRRHPGQKIFLCGCMMGQAHVVQKIRESYRHVDGVFNPHQLWRFPELLKSVLESGQRVFATEDSPGSIAEGAAASAQGGREGLGLHHVRVQQLLLLLHRALRSGPGAGAGSPRTFSRKCGTSWAHGIRDITLLGQNVNSYGKDLGLGVDFADLLARIAALPGDFWLRFMTSHPKDATKKLFDTMAASPKIAKQFHLPVQSGNDRVLREMNRRYTRAQYLSLVDYGRQVMPELVLTSDIIVGFPGETEAEFEDTLSLIEQVRYDALFTFIYSPRKGTPAAAMPDPVSRQEKNRWFDRLVAAQNRISEEIHRSYEGRTLRVLGGRHRGRPAHRPHRGRATGALFRGTRAWWASSFWWRSPATIPGA